MRVACVYCGGVIEPGLPAPYGLCAACLGLVEAELTAAAERVGRPSRPDAETVADEPLPAAFAAAAAGGHAPVAPGPG